MAVGWPRRRSCHRSNILFIFLVVRIVGLKGKSLEEVPVWLIGNLYKPFSSLPWRRAFLVSWSLTRNKLRWNSKRVSMQNVDALIRFIARWETWKTFCKRKDLRGDLEDLEPTCKMVSFLPLPTITLSFPYVLQQRQETKNHYLM